MSDQALDVCRVIRSTGAVFVAFCVASVATIVGTLVAWALVGSQLGQEGWKVRQCQLSSGNRHAWCACSFSMPQGTLQLSNAWRLRM